jgi:hypothetical protein
MSPMRWSQWPRSLRHELFSLAQTMGSWVWIPLEAWVCLRYFCVCNVRFRKRPCGLIPPSEEPCRLYIRLRNWSEIRRLTDAYMLQREQEEMWMKECLPCLRNIPSSSNFRHSYVIFSRRFRTFKSMSVKEKCHILKLCKLIFCSVNYGEYML